MCTEHHAATWSGCASPSPQCPGSVCSYRFVSADGPSPCRILFIGEGPARDEVREGRPFAGRAGMEFDRHYLPLAGLVRYEVRVDNATRCPMPGYANPSHATAKLCSRLHLPRELRHTQPDLVVLMGGVACSLADTPIDLDMHHGLPQANSLLGGLWEGMVFPTYHPAAGLHEGQMILEIRQDFRNLGDYLKGRLETPLGPYPRVERRLLGSPREVSRALEAVPDGYLEVAIDTESDGPDPWCLSFSTDPLRGYVVLERDREAVGEFARWLVGRRPLVVMHNSLYDLGVLRRMGVQVERWRDTMVDAYLLGDLPQGLKALAWRLLYLPMRSYEEVVLPPSARVARDYLGRADSLLEAALSCERRLKSGPRKGQLVRALVAGAPKDLSRLQRKVRSLVGDNDADPWDRWDGWSEQDRDTLRSVMGSDLPRPSIRHVPLGEAVDYAGLDAAATLAVYRKLSSRRVEVG